MFGSRLYLCVRQPPLGFDHPSVSLRLHSFPNPWSHNCQRPEHLFWTPTLIAFRLSNVIWLSGHSYSAP